MRILHSGHKKIVASIFILCTLLLFITMIFLYGTSTKVSMDLEQLNRGDAKSIFYEDLKNTYKSIAIEKDPKVAINALISESSGNAKTLSLCHDLLHQIGTVAFAKYGDIKNAMVYQSDFCNSGYLHGLFEAYFDSGDDNILAEFSNICTEYALGRRTFDLWQCNHGIGHGLMYYTDGDLDQSLAFCAERMEGSGIQECQNGVYMEFFNSEILPNELFLLSFDDPFKVCRETSLAKADCYFYLPTYVSQTQGVAFSDIFEICKKSEWGYKDVCIKGVGAEAMKRNTSAPNEVFALCTHAGSRGDQKKCVSAAVSMYINQSGSLGEGQDLCLSIDRAFEETCTKTVAAKESLFSLSL